MKSRSAFGCPAGNTLTGTTGEAWNVTTRTGQPLGIVTINYSFSFLYVSTTM